MKHVTLNRKSSSSSSRVKPQDRVMQSRATRMTVNFHNNTNTNTTNNNENKERQNEYIVQYDALRMTLKPDENDIVRPDDYVLPVILKAAKPSRIITKALSDGFFFEDLNTRERDALCDAMEYEMIMKDTQIIKQGEKGDYFYVLEEGHVEFYIGSKLVGDGKDGSFFGELSFLYNIERTATVLAAECCSLWKIHRKVMRSVLMTVRMANFKEKIKKLHNIELFSKLDNMYLKRIVNALSVEKFKEGDVIFKKGSVGDKFYILSEGVVSLTEVGAGNLKYDDKELESGSHFGDWALVRDDVRSTNAIAKTDCVLLYLTAMQFTVLLGPIQDAIQATCNKTKLLSVPSIKKLSPTDAEMASLVSTNKLLKVKFEKGETIFFGGETVFNPCLYLIHQGTIKFQSFSEDEENHELEDNDFFGEDYLNGTNTCYKHTAISDGHVDKCGKVKPTTCYVLSRKSFKAVFGGMSRSRSRKSIHPKDLDTSCILENMKQCYEEQQPVIRSLADVEIKQLIGKGGFADVYLVKAKETGEAFALKVQHKRSMKTKFQIQSVMREKEMMVMIDHPFVISLKSSFQDKTRLFLVTELYTGGDLYNMIYNNEGKGSPLPKNLVAFYSAGILQALDFMHERHILHRDLKPENVMINSNGYCVLIDLGLAKQVEDFAYTNCGTIVYSSPEKIKQQPYDKSNDIWVFGCMMYEMLHGDIPFKSAEASSLLAKILRGQYQFKKDPNLCDAEDLVSKLLIRNPALRLGSLAGGANDIREHEFFKSINFDDLDQSLIVPPHIPEKVDVFAGLDSSIAKLKDGKPIKPKYQKLFKGY